MPSSLHAQITRSAISPRLAIRIFLNMGKRYELRAMSFEHRVQAGGSKLVAHNLRTEKRRGRARPVKTLSDHFFGRITNNSWPYSMGWPLLASFLTTSPATSDSISFSSFIASTMQSTCPTSTESPTLAKGGAPGDG